MFEDNYRILDSLRCKSDEPIIDFVLENSINNEEGKTIKKLLCDPQTCGPLLISCNEKFEEYLDNNWYKVGIVDKNKN